MDTCLCMAESLPCSPVTIMTLLIGYTPIQNKKFKIKLKKKKKFKKKIKKKKREREGDDR